MLRIVPSEKHAQARRTLDSWMISPCRRMTASNQTLARVRTANKIDNAHLWSRVKAQIIPNNPKR